MIRQMSARKMDKTRDLLKSESKRLTGVARDAAKGMEKVGRLKATATVSLVIHRMRALAEAAKQARRSSIGANREESAATQHEPDSQAYASKHVVVPCGCEIPRLPQQTSSHCVNNTYKMHGK